MGSSEQILLDSGLTEDDTTARIADVLGIPLVPLVDSGELALVRPVASGGEQSVIGRVVGNTFQSRPGKESIYNYYDHLLDVWLSGNDDEALLHEEASRLFDEIVERLPWPVVHTRVEGFLFAASTPAVGRTDFPPRTSNSRVSRELWEPYARR